MAKQRIRFFDAEHQDYITLVDAEEVDGKIDKSILDGDFIIENVEYGTDGTGKVTLIVTPAKVDGTASTPVVHTFTNSDHVRYAYDDATKTISTTDTAAGFYVSASMPYTPTRLWEEFQYRVPSTFPELKTGDLILIGPGYNALIMVEGRVPPMDTYSVRVVSFGVNVAGGVEWYDQFTDFPATGADNVLYIDRSNMLSYVWNGTAYVDLFTPLRRPFVTDVGTAISGPPGAMSTVFHKLFWDAVSKTYTPATLTQHINTVVGSGISIDANGTTSQGSFSASLSFYLDAHTDTSYLTVPVPRTLEGTGTQADPLRLVESLRVQIATDHTDWTAHSANTTIHVTAVDKAAWNQVITDLATHVNNSDIHVTALQKGQWNNHIAATSANPHGTTLQMASIMTSGAVVLESGVSIYEYDSSGPVAGSKYLTSDEVTSMLQTGSRYKGQLQYGADTTAHMTAITGMQVGDKCGNHTTQSTYEFATTPSGSSYYPSDDGTGYWNELPHGMDTTGDYYDIAMWYGTWNGVVCAGDVTARVTCSDPTTPVFDLVVYIDALLDGEVTDEKIGGRGVYGNRPARTTMPTNDSRFYSEWLQVIYDCLKYFYAVVADLSTITIPAINNALADHDGRLTALEGNFPIQFPPRITRVRWEESGTGKVWMDAENCTPANYFRLENYAGDLIPCNAPGNPVVSPGLGVIGQPFTPTNPDDTLKHGWTLRIV